MNNPETLIKHYRQYRGLSQTELAVRAGISQSYLSEIENGTKGLTVALLYKIASVLEICPKKLLICNCKKCTCRKYKGDNK